LVSIPKPRSPFDRLRANGFLECTTAVFRLNDWLRLRSASGNAAAEYLNLTVLP